MAIKIENLKKRLGKFGSHFLFEWTIEMMHDNIIQGLKEYLAPIRSEDVPRMVSECQFPPFEHLDFSVVGDNVEYLETITELRLLKIVGEARPDIAQAIMERGMPGAEYIAKLRLHLLGLVKHPEKAMGELTDYKPKETMKLATCDKCGKSWPIPEDKALSLKECPFCNEPSHLSQNQSIDKQNSTL